MNGSRRIESWKSALLSTLLLLAVGSANAQTTQFTYQGRLTDAGNPATGTYDLQFRLLDALTGGNQVGATLVRDDVAVTSGNFSVSLDFGAAAFPGAARWLEISVRPGASTGAFTTLSPRQPINSTPYAIKSLNAAAADSLSLTCVGCVTSAQIGSLPTNSASYIQNTNTQQASSNFNISGNGVIGGSLGIGTGTALTDGLIHAKGPSPVRILGDTTTLSGSEIVDFFARSTLFNSELGGMRIQRQAATGSIDTLLFAAAAGNAASEKMRIGGDGNVGIGTATPGFRLDVADRIRLRGGSAGTAGLWLYGQNPTPPFVGFDAAFVGLLDNDRMGFFGNSGAGWGLTMNTATGKIGIGTSSPATKFHISGSGDVALRLEGNSSSPDAQVETSFAGVRRWTFGSTGNTHPTPNAFFIYQDTFANNTAAGQTRMLIWENGNVGIGTTNPAHRLHVLGDRIRLENAGKQLDLRADGSVLDLQSSTNSLWISSLGPNGDNKVIINPFPESGNVGIGTAAPQAKLDVVGTTRTGVVQITGGADFSEHFDIAVANRQKAMNKPEAGMVVAIDATNPGKLQLSTRAYDRRVAGVISGAGGINAGLVMGQQGSVADGKLPVALSGRVYCWADATYGAIKPGDLLTTSSTPGHAMRVNSYAKAQGAIIGKAMTGLKQGRGLVLLLVALQ